MRGDAWLRASCAPDGGATGPTAEGTRRQGSAVALARDGRTLVAYVAARGEGLLHTVDVDGRFFRGATRVGGAPDQVLVLPDRRVLVTLSDRDRVVVYQPGAADAGRGTGLRKLCERQVPAGAYGLAITEDGKNDPTDELVVIGPASKWVASSTPDHRERTRPHVGSFTRVRVPVERGRSASVLFASNHRQIVAFDDLRAGRVTRAEDTHTSPVVELRVDVMWPAGDPEPSIVAQTHRLEGMDMTDPRVAFLLRSDATLP